MDSTEEWIMQCIAGFASLYKPVRWNISRTLMIDFVVHLSHPVDDYRSRRIYSENFRDVKSSFKNKTVLYIPVLYTQVYERKSIGGSRYRLDSRTALTVIYIVKRKLMRALVTNNCVVRCTDNCYCCCCELSCSLRQMNGENKKFIIVSVYMSDDDVSFVVCAIWCANT